MELQFRIEKVHYASLYDLLIKTKEEFGYTNLQSISQYAKKLATFANFITCTDAFENLIGLIAYYDNMIPNAYISHVWVSKNERGKRICERMLSELNKTLIARNFEAIRLEVLNSNTSAINAYTRFGFSKVEQRDNKMLMCKTLSTK